MSVWWPPLAALDDARASRLMEVGEWLVLPEDEEGELVDGRLVEEEEPDAVHELAVSWFIRVLGTWLGSFEIFERNTAGHYVKVVGATGGRIAPVPGCEGLAIDLDALWTELSRLSES